MLFQKVVFHEIPQIGIAHSHRTENYKFSTSRPPGNMEISYIKEGPTVATLPDGQILHVPAPSISATIYNGERFSSYSDAPLHIHYTFTLKGNWSVYPHSAEDVLTCVQSDFLTMKDAPLTVLLPIFTADMKCVSELAPCFYEIIASHSGASPFRTVSSLQHVFHIFSVLTDWCISEALRIGEGDLSPSAMMYCRRAAAYMQKHIARPVSAEEIANELQISLPHLSRVFKSVTGATLIEYTNRIKINHAKQLLESGRMTTREIAQQVGIQDEKYFCRLFKKHTGQTTSAYKKSV